MKLLALVLTACLLPGCAMSPEARANMGEFIAGMREAQRNQPRYVAPTLVPIYVPPPQPQVRTVRMQTNCVVMGAFLSCS